MKFRALLLFIVMVVAVNLPWSAEAFAREEVPKTVVPWSTFLKDGTVIEGELVIPKQQRTITPDEICTVRQRWTRELPACPRKEGWKPTQPQLLEILDDHERWLARSIETDATIPGRAVLCLADLQNADLRSANLQGAVLWSSNLQGADLSGANLQEADLLGANLQKAKLVHVNLQEADLFSANLQEANLFRANLQKAGLWFASLKNADLRFANLQEAELVRANLQEADLSNTNMQKAELMAACLRKADLRSANLPEAGLFGAILQEAELGEANLQDADLLGANLQKANLKDANLQKADIRYANLQKADLDGADVAGARLADATVAGAIYAPASPSPDGYLERVKGLADVILPYDEYSRITAVSGMVQLRKLLHEAGLREGEREATYAIEHHKALHARVHGTAFQRFGGWLQLIFFEWTTGWGLYPSRALVIALVVMFLLGFVVYPAPIAAAPSHASPKHGIFQVWTAEEYGSPEGRVSTVDEVEIKRLSGKVPKAFLWGMWFSVLSAFHIGWRDLNVGTWLSRLQPFPFALRARGWVRIVSGFQSLISVYLVAMWVLTYFGRPFQ